MSSVLSQSLMAARAFGNAKQEAARTSHPAVKIAVCLSGSDGLENEQ